MSNFIPMVSSSPPPLEDSGGFDDWGDDDDFGTFTGANNNSEFTPFQSDTNAEPDVWKNKTSGSVDDEFGNFADFGNMSSSTENITDTPILQNDVELKNKPLSLDLEKSENFQTIPNLEKESSDNEDAKNMKEDFEIKDNIESENTSNIMRNSTRDSGIFSTDISPSPVSDVRLNLQDGLKGSEENLYDSSSEDSTSKDLSETVDLNDQMESKNSYNNETNNSYIPETSHSQTASTIDNESNEIPALNQEISGCDLTVLEQLNDTEKINKSVSDNVSDMSQSDLDMEVKTSPSQNSPRDPLEDGSNEETSSIASEDKLVQNDCNKEGLDNPPTSSNCDNSNSAEDSLTHSYKDSESSVVADSAAVKDSEIDMADSVIENGVIDTEGGNLTSSDNCSDENNDKYPKNDTNVDSSPCSIEVEDNKEENSGSADSKQHSKDSSDDVTDSQQSKECSNKQHATSDSQNVGNGEIDKEIDSVNDKEIDSGNDKEIDSGSVLNSQTDCSEKLDSLSDKSAKSVQDSYEDVTCDLTESNENSPDEPGSNDKMSGEYDSSESSNLKVEEKEECIDDDFDDFADFQTVSEFTTSEKTKTVTDLNDESESGWGFQNASPVDGNDDGDDWATFKEPVVSQNATNDNFGDENIGDDDDNDDDFGDFGDFSESTDFNSFTPQTQENFKSATPITKSEPPRVEPQFKTNLFKRQRKVSESVVDDVVDEMINESDDVTSDMSSQLNTIDACLMSKDTAVKVTKVQSKDNPELWTKLKNLNSTTAIKYQWPDSSVNKKLFTTLKIDTQNILLGHRKQHVPIYASNLTMLEPTKGPIAPKSNSDPQLVDTDQSKTQQLQNINMEIPPVQFDWTTSGLTNPLEENRKTLGLDFLVVQETEATSRSTVLSGDNGSQEIKTNLQPLENILATLKVSTMKKTKHTDNLGQEAAKIITSLPDLSFMQAKVLMFPLRQQNNN